MRERGRVGRKENHGGGGVKRTKRTTLEAGREVSLRVAGFVPAPHAKWVKRTEKDEYTGEKDSYWEREGAVGIKVTDLGEVELGGEWHGE